MVNSYNGTYSGNQDAFVTKFTNDGQNLSYSTFLGGAGGSDRGYGIAVDAANCAYVTGGTNSADFPMQNPYDGTHGGNQDAFVTKFSAAGNTLAYSTYLGGRRVDSGWGIAVDAANCTYITGYTQSVDFPMLSPYQGTYSGNQDAFVTKFTNDGQNLAYSTYLGGARPDSGWGIAVDAFGCAYVTGQTNSADFPMLSPYQGTYSGNRDAFVTKLGDPDITVDPTSFDLGSVEAGSSNSAQTVTVTSSGTGSLTIGTITLGGTNAGEFAIQNDTCSGQTLAPGASATVQVVFSPTSAGAKTATLSIPSDDPDEATVNVALSGTGTQAQQRRSSGGGTVTGTQGQTPPEIMLAYMNVHPQQQYAGRSVTITTNVSNTGGSTGQYTVTLMINGQVEETRLVSVGAQSALPVKFIVTRDVPGTYTVTIGNQQSSFTVLGSRSSAGSPVSGGLIAIILVGILVLITAVVLLLAFRRPAW